MHMVWHWWLPSVHKHACRRRSGTYFSNHRRTTQRVGAQNTINRGFGPSSVPKGKFMSGMLHPDSSSPWQLRAPNTLLVVACAATIA